MAWIKKHLFTILLWLMIIVGAGLVAYPSVADWWNSIYQSQAIGAYMDAVTEMDAHDREHWMQDAEDYNAALAASGMLWSMSEHEQEKYESLLSIDGNGMIGVIEIPKLQIYLPIYHGTDDDVLQSGVGHVSASSLPVGGESTHTILSGHRGLPSARLFTDLDQIVEGDIWTLTVLDRTLTYEADQIRVVDPDDLAALRIEDGKDYCSLVTCTPYGVNTHRLVIRGHRIANLQGEADVLSEAIQIKPGFIIPFLGVPILIVLLVLLLVETDRQTKARCTRVAAWREMNLPASDKTESRGDLL